VAQVKLASRPEYQQLGPIAEKSQAKGLAAAYVCPIFSIAKK